LPTKPKILESDIQAEIKDYLNWCGWFCFKNHQSLGSYKGVADLYALKDGRSVWIEVKTPKGKLSKHQEKFKNLIEAKGGEYIVARCLDDVREAGM
jgi:Holliday junction resolvase